MAAGFAGGGIPGSATALSRSKVPSLSFCRASWCLCSSPLRCFPRPLPCVFAAPFSTVRPYFQPVVKAAAPKPVAPVAVAKPAAPAARKVRRIRVGRECRQRRFFRSGAFCALHHFQSHVINFSLWAGIAVAMSFDAEHVSLRQSVTFARLVSARLIVHCSVIQSLWRRRRAWRSPHFPKLPFLFLLRLDACRRAVLRSRLPSRRPPP
ncbi:unnamed protein product [Phaeothamnion confervicola]